MTTRNFSNKILSKNENDFDSIMESLKAARQYQDDRIKVGSSRVENYVVDVESDWLETMQESNNDCLEETTSKPSQ